MTAAEKIPDIVAQELERVMPGSGRIFNLWLDQKIVDVVNATISDLSDANDEISSLDSNKSDVSHSHNLNDLTEKSYNSLTDSPVADVASDGPGDVSNITSPSCATGADTIDRTAFNAVLSTLESEINAISSALNSLKTAHNDIIDKLQGAGLMST